MRTIKKIKSVFDVSPVTEPAYSDTSVAVRSLETFCETSKNESHENSARYWQKRAELLEKLPI
jgi:phage head maturation protease